jgi:hypothetical protein
MKFPLVVDPPSGWMYGFPKECHEFLDSDFNMKQWLIDNGYPEDQAEFASHHYRYWFNEE